MTKNHTVFHLIYVVHKTILCTSEYVSKHLVYMYTMNRHIPIWKDGQVCMSVDIYYHFKNKTRNIKWNSVIKTHKGPKWLNFHFPKSNWFMIIFCIYSNKIDWLLISTCKLMPLRFFLCRSYGSALFLFEKKIKVWISRRCQYFPKFGTVLLLLRVNSMYCQ